MNMNKTKKFAVGAVILAAAGYIAGILTAPKSGKQTRKDIVDTTKKGASEAEKQLKQLYSELDKLVDETKRKGEDLSGKAKKELDDIVAKAKESKAKAQDKLAVFRKDGGDSAELKQAISDASKAVEHLRNFLSK